MVRTSVALFLATVAMLTWSRVALADLDCRDFSSHQEAQRYFDQQHGDPDNLDADRDGMACEPYSGDDQEYDQEYEDAMATKFAIEDDFAYSNYLMSLTREDDLAAPQDPEMNYREPEPEDIPGYVWKWLGIGLMALIVFGFIWEQLENRWWDWRRRHGR